MVHHEQSEERMRLKEYDEKNGMRVWLGREELASFVDEASSPEQRVAFLLAGRAGLRRKEITKVTPADFVTSQTGTHVRIWQDYAKREHYREPPVPDEVSNIVDTLAYDMEPDEPIVDVDGSTVYRWVQRAAERLRAETADEGWAYLDVHDLRRTWGTSLLEQGVLPTVVMSWGGWEDWETFRAHYLGEFTPEAIRRERAKVDFLDGDVEADPANPGFRPGAPKSAKPHFVD